MLQSSDTTSRDRLSWWRWATLLIYPGYLALTALTIGLRPEHVVMAVAFVLLAWIGPRLRELSYRCLPFFVTAVAYENIRYVTHLRGPIHIADLYHAERRWFGISVGGRKITLPEYFHTRTTVFLDLICGFAYLTYLYELFLLAIYFYFRERKRFNRLAWGFLLVNLMGMVTYLLYPAAPPWYAMKYGLGPARLDAPPDPAGTAAFDKLLGISYFEQFYSRNANVFGAMPSLHVAYPVLVFCVVAAKGWLWSLSTSGFALLVSYSAVYLRHHYVWDVLLGAIYGAATFGLLLLIERVRAPSQNPVAVQTADGHPAVLADPASK